MIEGIQILSLVISAIALVVAVGCLRRAVERWRETPRVIDLSSSRDHYCPFCRGSGVNVSIGGVTTTKDPPEYKRTVPAPHTYPHAYVGSFGGLEPCVVCGMTYETNDLHHPSARGIA